MIAKPPERSETSVDPSGETDRFWTLPNGLCLLRLAGSPCLLALGLAGYPQAFLYLFVFLVMTDWVDGKLAILLDQRSVYGARLDSWADAALYTALAIGGSFLRWDTLVGEAIWILAAVGSYVVSTCAGFVKFGRWPSYHTRAAKTSWFLITVGVIVLFAEGPIWPFRLALAAVLVTNLEALALTALLSAWQPDVSSLYQAWQDYRNTSD